MSPTVNYLDNLELVDRTLADFRRAMERAGTWDTTALLITADHPFRPEIWKSGFTPEEEQITRGKEYRFVPFILKLPGQTTRLTYDTPFNVVLIHHLTRALLSREISDPEAVIQWLDHNRSSMPVD